MLSSQHGQNQFAHGIFSLNVLFCLPECLSLDYPFDDCAHSLSNALEQCGLKFLCQDFGKLHF